MNHYRRILTRAALAALITAGASVAARADTFVNILTGGTSGVYYPVGVALTKIIGEKVPGTRPNVQATKASVENLNLLQQGKGEIAFTLGDSLQSAWAGDNEAGFRTKLDKLRGIAAVYPNYIQIVATKESGIRTLADLKGKRISVGAARSGTELNARAVFAAAGLSYKDMSKVEYLPFAESVELMKNRQLDATLQSAGLGVASLRDLSTTVDIVVVEVPGAVIDKIGAPFVKEVVPANTYRGQDQPVATAAVVNFLVTRSDLPDDLVYNMTKAIWDNLDEVKASHAATRVMELKNAMAGMPVPLHPGAVRFYKEKGLAVTN